MANKHFVTLPDGTKDKRVSASRTYTHVVIGQHSRESDEDRARAQCDSDRNNFRFYRDSAAATPGVPFRTGDYTFTFDAEEIARSAEHVEGHENADSYATAQLAKRLRKIEEQASKGYYDAWFAITWAGRPDLAAKAAAPYERNPGYRNVTILPVDPA